MTDIKLTSFFDVKVIFQRAPSGFIIKIKRDKIVREVGALIKTKDDMYNFVKVVNLDEHKGKGQYYVYKKAVATSKHAIDEIENRFGIDKLKNYVVRFVKNNRTVLFLFIDWIYYMRNRTLVSDAEYEVQYQIPLYDGFDEDLDFCIRRNRRMAVYIDYKGKVRKVV